MSGCTAVRSASEAGLLTDHPVTIRRTAAEFSTAASLFATVAVLAGCTSSLSSQEDVRPLDLMPSSERSSSVEVPTEQPVTFDSNSFSATHCPIHSCGNTPTTSGAYIEALDMRGFERQPGSTVQALSGVFGAGGGCAGL